MKTLVSVLKNDAVINVQMTVEDVAAFQSILLKHLDKQIKLDDSSWNIIQELCERIDDEARNQDQTETRELEM